MSLGFEQAGFDIVAAVEIDPVHAAVHEFNFPECMTIPISVRDLTGAEIRKRANLGRRKVGIVFGGAPCQGFSLIGQRALDDPRNSLVKDFARIVHELRADYFVFENVKGLTVGKQKRFLQEIVEEFEAYGYDVLSPWKVLNAHHYGVPQDRNRLFLMGCRRGAKLPVYPEPISRPAGGKGIEGIDAGPSCADALGDLPDAEKFEDLKTTDAVRRCVYGEPSDYAKELRCLTNDAWHYGYPRAWNPDVLTSSRRTEHTEISRLRFSETEPGSVEPISRFFKLSGDGVSNTLRAGTDAARGAFTSPRPIHYQYPRCVTVREMARLHGFPDWFRFHGTKWHGARQIGNSVPPPLARAVATEVARAMGYAPERVSTVLELGDEKTLQMDLTQASAYWGVENPIGRRDKKSGAKKRKQHETEADRLAAIG